MARYKDFPHANYQAQQIWLVLISKAYNRQLTTYREIATILGFEGAGVLANQLGHIMYYCQQNELPALTVLVVNDKTGQPGEGFESDIDQNAARAKVFNFAWYELVPPTPDEFSAAWKAGRAAAR
jgi:hypothetical protein